MLYLVYTCYSLRNYLQNAKIIIEHADKIQEMLKQAEKLEAKSKISEYEKKQA